VRARPIGPLKEWEMITDFSISNGNGRANPQAEHQKIEPEIFGCILSARMREVEQNSGCSERFFSQEIFARDGKIKIRFFLVGFLFRF
jgi:hypothetical protein